jgi:putative peptide zinc metalloprotease protein
VTPPPGTLTQSSPELATSGGPGGELAPERAHAPSLVRRGDGQTFQLTPLLYEVLEAIDGRRDQAQIAAVVGERVNKSVDAEDIAYLVESKLQPMGVLRGADGTTPAMKKANPLLALRFRFVVSNPRTTRKITKPFAHLFRPFVAVPLLVAFALISAWLLFDKGLGSAVHDALYQPGVLLVIFALTMLSAGFHEFGHAAACRYGGATPGVMGAGLYLVWPAFYTDVTDSYRLDRRGRLRVDVGGLYFNAIFAVATFTVWAFTRWDSVLLVIPAQLLQMLRQLLPFVRFDGYHILADLTGVPDLFSHIKPTLLGLLPRRWRRPHRRPLKRWARVVVTTWVLLVIPILAFSLVMMVRVLPRVAATAWDSLGMQWDVLQQNWVDGAAAEVAVRILAMFTIALPVAAMTYMVVRVANRTVRRAWQWSEGNRKRRALTLIVAAAAVALMAWSWWPQGQYEPIARTERGTLTGGLDPIGMPATATAPLAQADTAAPVLPAADAPVQLTSYSQRPVTSTGAPLEPRLGVVLIPEDGTEAEPEVILLPEDTPTDTAPSEAPSDEWPFPFNHPREARPHDNQALAVNTTDGTSVYDVAIALVWVDESGDIPVDHRNDAYALTSCTDCQSVAVAFEVIFLVGQADTIIPENIAIAVNYDCVRCTSFALAIQLIASLTEMPSEEGMRRLEAVWGELETLVETIEEVPLTEVHTRLVDIERRILEIIATDDGASATTAEESATDTTTDSETTTTSPSGEVTVEEPVSTSGDATTTTGDATATGDTATDDGTVTNEDSASAPESSDTTTEPTPEPSPETSTAPEPEPQPTPTSGSTESP